MIVPPADLLPLAHHNAVAALPVFAPALIVCLVLVVHRIRHRGYEEDDEELAPRPDA